MADELYGVTGRTRDRIEQALGRMDNVPADPGRRGRPRAATLVICESDTPAGTSGAAAICYPATVLIDEADALDVTTSGACWLTLWDDFGVPAIPRPGRVYPAILAGYLEVGSDERPRAFAAATCCDPDGPESGWSGSGWSGESGVIESGTAESGGTESGTGGGTDPTVIIGPMLDCVEGTRPVLSARMRIAVNSIWGNLELEPYDFNRTDECCVDCEDWGSVDESGGGGGSVASGASGESGQSDGYCEFYTAGGVTLRSRGGTALTRRQWRGGNLFLGRRPANPRAWLLDNRYAGGPYCAWQNLDWDGTGCATFSRAYRMTGCAETIEVCCDVDGDGSTAGSSGGGGGATGGYVNSCSRNLNSTLYASLSSGDGTMSLAWDGSTYWAGSKVLGCGRTLYLRVSAPGGTEFVEWSCNGTDWTGSNPAVSDCAPWQPPDLVLLLADTGIGCGAPCSSAYVVVLSE